MKTNHMLIIGLGGALLLHAASRPSPGTAPAIAAISALDAELNAELVANPDKANENREKFIQFVLGGKVRKKMIQLIEKTLYFAGNVLNPYQFAVTYALDPKFAATLAGDPVLYNRLVAQVVASPRLTAIAKEKSLKKALINAVIILKPQSQKQFAASCARRTLEIWQKAVPGDRVAAQLVEAIQKNADGLLSDASLSSMRLDFQGILSAHRGNPVAMAAGHVFMNAAINAHSVAATKSEVAASFAELSRFVSRAEADAKKVEKAVARGEAKAAQAAENAAKRATRTAEEDASSAVLRKIIRSAK